MNKLLVSVYVAAIAAANIIVSIYGPTASILTAFFLIGLVITTRDRLHDEWRGQVRFRMLAMIAAAGGVSYLIQADAGRIATASVVAFVVSESVDAIVYHFLRGRPWFERVNGSNAVAAVVDSVLFPALAFGAFLPLIVMGQFAAKFGGGFIWSVVLRNRKTAAAVALVVASLFGAPVSAQSVSVGIGQYANDFTRDDVVEAVVLFPEVLGLRPNMVASWSIDGSMRPTLLPQLGVGGLNLFPVIIGFDVGVSGGPWNDYKQWEPHLSASVIAFVSGRFKVVGIYTAQPWNKWARGVVLKADLTLF